MYPTLLNSSQRLTRVFRYTKIPRLTAQILTRQILVQPLIPSSLYLGGVLQQTAQVATPISIIAKAAAQGDRALKANQSRPLS